MGVSLSGILPFMGSFSFPDTPAWSGSGNFPRSPRGPHAVPAASFHMRARSQKTARHIHGRPLSNHIHISHQDRVSSQALPSEPSTVVILWATTSFT